MTLWSGSAMRTPLPLPTKKPAPKSTQATRLSVRSFSIFPWPEGHIAVPTCCLKMRLALEQRHPRHCLDAGLVDFWINVRPDPLANLLPGARFDKEGHGVRPIEEAEAFRHAQPRPLLFQPGHPLSVGVHLLHNSDHWAVRAVRARVDKEAV